MTEKQDASHFFVVCDPEIRRRLVEGLERQKVSRRHDAGVDLAPLREPTKLPGRHR
jgi:hypothetical protein